MLMFDTPPIAGPSPASPQLSGAATSKRDGGRGWMLGSRKRTVNGITYLNPAS